jgi:hypothetical protein
MGEEEEVREGRERGIAVWSQASGEIQEGGGEGGKVERDGERERLQSRGSVRSSSSSSSQAPR